jgi:protein gp37
MPNHSKIEWTETTWNPVRGCVKISPGCKHCYAETFAERFRNVAGHPYEQGFDLRLVPEKLIEPLTWTKPFMVFVNSMSDLFQEGVPTDFIKAVLQVMVTANWHTYQVLTKRTARMTELLNGELAQLSDAQHIWWGTSVENVEHGGPRIEHLQQVRVPVRFLSIEPLLEDLGQLNLDGIHWVIVGGESGPGARPMKQQWVEDILRQCRARNIPFFFKQWGGRQKSRTGRRLNGQTYDEMPAILRAPFPSTRNDRRRLIADIGGHPDVQPSIRLALSPA